MAVLTRAQEREERRKMGRGLSTSVVALFLCWVPVLGILLAAVGFISVVCCVTRKYRARFAVYVTVATLILVLCAGALTGEVYAYSRNPDILSNAGAWLLEKITGETVDDGNYLGGYDYSDMDMPGLGLNDALFASGYYDAEGNFIPYENDAWNEDDGASDEETNPYARSNENEEQPELARG